MITRVHLGVGLCTGAITCLTLGTTKESVALSVTMTAIGSILPDVDLDFTKIKGLRQKLELDVIMFITCVLELGALFGFNLMRLLTNSNLQKEVLLKSIIVLPLISIYLYYAIKSEHRHFTHRIYGMCLTAIIVFVLFGVNVTLYFIVGYISHILTDLLNKKKINFLGLPNSDGVALSIIEYNSVCAELIGIAGYMVFEFLILCIRFGGR